MSEFQRSQSDIDSGSLPFNEAVRQLHTEPYLLRQWSRHYARFLSANAESDHPRYSNGDIITLSVVQTLLIQGYSEGQIQQHLIARQSDLGSKPSFMIDPTAADSQLAVGRNSGDSVPDSLQDVFGALADNQRAILSNQATVRDIVGVVVQDNFSLKEENRKLRERMLDLERTIAEYQRREELRKERLESRLRALEATTGGLQQQIAQLIQVIRKKRRGWFW